MMRKLALSVAGLLLITGLLAGCSNDETDLTTASLTASDDFEYLDFNDPNGGLTATDEDVAFGDEGLKAMLLAEDQEAVDDPFADDPLVREMEGRSRHRHELAERERPHFTYLRLNWGMLRGPEDTTAIERPCDMTDWTGTIRTDRGIVVVKRLIKFESPADHVVFPRLDRRTVAFVSRTWCGQDGMVIQIIEPPTADSTATETPNKLYIDTPLFEGEFLVNELAEMDEVFEVGDQGTSIQLTGFGLEDIDVCPKGWLSGRYRHMSGDRPDSLDTGDRGERRGSFAGAWVTLDGRIHGFMRGGYGINAEGERVFHGKYIDRRGNFRGLMRGNWEPVEDSDGLGEFRGHWVTRNGEVEGVLGGRAHPVSGYPGGFFEGRWATSCDEEAEAIIVQ